MAFDDREGYAVTAGPAMRMLIDLGDLDASRWVNQSGVSGHAFHRHYDDQTELWANQQTLAVRLVPRSGRGSCRDTPGVLALVPWARMDPPAGIQPTHHWKPGKITIGWR